ncbi:hypothetical protein [Streptomyces litchfieldiae]|uniref:Transferase n=1 Tax=Streptomyces litchfieldiae TaxID=3075543 RepID=A0ABU2MKC7_9ACTN|nr:hypothetical protein [Streptomyces sp. DSM 44938]MDT0341564.1 hypothetical protein [Streptomyces sp. DSM 44938]
MTTTVTKDKLPRADCAMDAEGRLTTELSSLPGDAAEPELRIGLRPKKGEPETTAHTVPLSPDPGAPGRWRADLDGLPQLAEGRWDVWVLPGPGADRLRVVPGLRDLRVLAGGRSAVADGPLAVRVPYATKDGYFAIRAWVRAAHAEAGDLRVAGRELTVRGTLVGARAGAGAAGLLKRRGKGGPVVEVPLSDGGDGSFSFTVRYEDLPSEPVEGEPVFWDVFVRPAAKASRVRVARLLDDVADKKHVFVYPATGIGPLSFRPYYTVDNDLSVEVARG